MKPTGDPVSRDLLKEPTPHAEPVGNMDGREYMKTRGNPCPVAVPAQAVRRSPVVIRTELRPTRCGCELWD
jgi:hypothetical protein